MTSKKTSAELLLARKLVAWFQEHQREMPWRKTRDPYAIWLSEIMLQQTQVATVIPYYERFLKKFPTVKDLAAAPLDDVLKLWAGLGYYSRARNLHRGAQTVVERFNAIVPDTPELILEIPGIGAYTAGAILSIAYAKPQPLVDGNVARVFSRLFLLKGDWRKNPLKDELWRIAKEVVGVCEKEKKIRPGDLNQALMELGATVCTPANPQCLLCPVGELCEARKKGVQDQYPEVLTAKKSPVWKLTAWLVRDVDGRVLFAQRNADGLFGGMWELPTEKTSAETPKLKATRKLTHILSHRELRISLAETQAKGWPRDATDPKKFPCWSGNYERYQWLALKAAQEGQLALASVQRRLIGDLE